MKHNEGKLRKFKISRIQLTKNIVYTVQKPNILLPGNCFFALKFKQILKLFKIIDIKLDRLFMNIFSVFFNMLDNIPLNS